MRMDGKEAEHTIKLLESAEEALTSNNSSRLRELSDQKIHTACCIQDIESITITIVLYSLSKLVERKEKLEINKWGSFVKKFNSVLSTAIDALKDNNLPKYREYILKSKSTIESLSIDLKPYIKDVLQNASINKASRLYEHGISLGQTASLLGVTQWELLAYTGQRMQETNLSESLEVKKRARMAMEFFS